MVSPECLKFRFRATCVVAQTAVVIHKRFIDNVRRKALTIQRSLISDSAIAQFRLLNTFDTIQSFFVVG